MLLGGVLQTDIVSLVTTSTPRDRNSSVTTTHLSLIARESPPCDRPHVFRGKKVAYGQTVDTLAMIWQVRLQVGRNRAAFMKAVMVIIRGNTVGL